ncbi:hypothetical protein HZA73_04580 [candidate division TA06 bacterium]|nr:hypothetical protein [candidate division TA06 bacterium]
MSINNPRFHRRSIRLPEYDYSQEGVYYITICAQDRKCLFGEIRNGKIALSECGRIVDDWWQRMPERYSGVILDEYVIMPNHMHAIIVVIDDAICRGEVASPLGGTVDGITKPGDGVEMPGVAISSMGESVGGMTNPGVGIEIPGEVTSPMGGSVGDVMNPVDGMTKPGEVTSPLRGTGKHTLGQILAFYKYQTTKSINAIYNSPGNKIWQRNYWEHVIRNKKSLHKIREYIRNNPWHWASDDKNPQHVMVPSYRDK